MKQILKYLLFLMIGIIIFVLYNGIDGFSIGVPWCLPPNPDAQATGEAEAPAPAPPITFRTEKEAYDWWDGNLILDDDGTSVFLLPVECDEDGVPLQDAVLQQPVETGEVDESFTVSIDSLQQSISLDINRTTNLETFYQMVNRGMADAGHQLGPLVGVRWPSHLNSANYRLMFGGTFGRTVDEGGSPLLWPPGWISNRSQSLSDIMGTLHANLRRLRTKYRNWRADQRDGVQPNLDSLDDLFPLMNRALPGGREDPPMLDRPGGSGRSDYVSYSTVESTINNRIAKILNCLDLFAPGDRTKPTEARDWTHGMEYFIQTTEYLGNYFELYFQIFRRHRRELTLPFHIADRALIDHGVLNYINEDETEMERFTRIYNHVDGLIRENIRIIESQLAALGSGNEAFYRYMGSFRDQYLDRIYNRFQNIDNLLDLLFDMTVNHMFTLEPTLLDTLVYFQAVGWTDARLFIQFIAERVADCAAHTELPEGDPEGS